MNEHLICPITLKIFKDPVISKSGITYEKRAIIKWLKNNKTDPLSRESLTIEDLRPNLVIKNMINMIPKKDYYNNYLYIDELIEKWNEAITEYNNKFNINNDSIHNLSGYGLLRDNLDNINYNTYNDLSNDFKNSNIDYKDKIYKLIQLSNFLNCPKLYKLAIDIEIKFNKRIEEYDELDEEYFELNKKYNKLKKENNILRESNYNLRVNFYNFRNNLINFYNNNRLQINLNNLKLIIEKYN
jgi:hypothetical protein